MKKQILIILFFFVTTTVLGQSNCFEHWSKNNIKNTTLEKLIQKLDLPVGKNEYCKIFMKYPFNYKNEIDFYNQVFGNYFSKPISVNLFSQINSDLYIQKTGFKEIDLKAKNDTIKFIFSSTNKPKPTILFLQGSLPLPIVFYNEKITNTLIPFNLKPYLEKFNFIIIARKGIPLVGSYEKDPKGYLDNKGKVPNVYLQNDNLKYRTFQANEVLKYLYKQNWVKRDSIFVIGHSEGYRVASKLSENNKIINKLVCMSADPFNRTTEEIVKQRIKCLSNNQDSIFQSKINDFIDNYKGIGNNIEEYKDDHELYNWASYNSELTFESLKKI
jgi:hypothetical protein